ncbi:uncharacterized protein METZ01_LOCUS497270 [marine metagenome]|uniref:Uncharacterized protein n=1 Tax=marine metagenome TaxID=408172 RepID=A0A383DIV2_9ZZZZ
MNLNRITKAFRRVPGVPGAWRQVRGRAWRQGAGFAMRFSARQQSVLPVAAKNNQPVTCVTGFFYCQLLPISRSCSA